MSRARQTSEADPDPRRDGLGLRRRTVPTMQYLNPRIPPCYCHCLTYSKIDFYAICWSICCANYITLRLEFSLSPPYFFKILRQPAPVEPAVIGILENVRWESADCAYCT